MRRPEGITMIAIWFFIQASFALLCLGGMTIGFLGLWTGGGEYQQILFGTLGMILGVMAIIGAGAAYLATGLGLWKLKEWSRSAAVVLAILQLLLIPIGTIAGITILLYLNRNEEAKAVFGIKRAG